MGISGHATGIEKASLEAHVELCAVRYNNLEAQMTALDARTERIENSIDTIKQSVVSKTAGIDKQIISIFTSILGVLVAGLLGFITHSIFK